MMRSSTLLLMVSAVVGCASSQTPADNAAQLRPTVKRVSIEQLAFGPTAMFVTCAENACRRRTLKTLIGPDEASMTSVVTNIQPIVPPTKTEVVLIGFPFGGSALTPDARKALRDKLPVARRASQILVRGRTDSIGSVTANTHLALRRAQAVRDFLLRSDAHLWGVFKIDANGTCCYIAENDTASWRASNRRVEVEFVLPQTREVGAS